MISDGAQFAKAFQDLTGHRPLSWQTRLYGEFTKPRDRWPDVIDLPTGMGKTMVMAIWLIARANKLEVPTRLIYVVDRRTVVDQATDLAEDLAFLLAYDDPKAADMAKQKPELVQRKKRHADALALLGRRLHPANNPLAISTLRGQLADNREWSRDPSRPAIIIGTVDLIGSALLFSGYRSSYKRRPLEAGLLGQDSLLVLDEAHLSKPFQKLIGAIDQFQQTRNGKPCGKPMRVIRMSATAESDVTTRFALEDSDLVDKTIEERFNATKRLTIEPPVAKNKLNDEIKSAAIGLAENEKHKGKRIVVFVRSPDDAAKIAELIRRHPAQSKAGRYSDSVEVLTGTMRGLERDELVEKPVLKRFLDGDENPDLEVNRKPVFLISTSAGEVGFDLNADHLVGDAAPLDSWIQRLGRVNRRGQGTAMVRVFVESPGEKARGADATKHTIASASVQAIEALKQLPEAEPLNIDDRSAPIVDASPVALRNLNKPAKALFPTPEMVELTDILLDTWSMTSITEPMPGRPEVGPWLRGIDVELPRTTIAWRTELDLVNDYPDPVKALQNIFAKHPIRPHESVTTNSYRVVEFLKQACKLRDQPGDLPNTRILIRLSRGKIFLTTIAEVIKDPGILNAEPTLILPAIFGGLNAAGMLDAETIPTMARADDPQPRSFDVADHPGYEQREDASPRLRLIIRRTDDNWAPESLPGGVTISDRVQLEASYATSTELFADLRKNGLRIRLVQTIDLDMEGDARRSLVMLSPVSNRNRPEDQSLNDHVGAVQTEAKRIAGALGLTENDPICVALLFAARWHDEGKKADIWQRFVYGPDATGYKGKSSKTRDPKSLLGYRHEFGTLLRIHDPERCNTTGCGLPPDFDARELALHLIATHHGAGRPNFKPAIYRDFAIEKRDEIHTAIIRRFARLQRKYGWWCLAWLENLLRCADAMASADTESEDEIAEVGE